MCDVTLQENNTGLTDLLLNQDVNSLVDELVNNTTDAAQTTASDDAKYLYIGEESSSPKPQSPAAASDEEDSPTSKTADSSHQDGATSRRLGVAASDDGAATPVPDDVTMDGDDPSDPDYAPGSQEMFSDTEDASISLSVDPTPPRSAVKF